MRIVCPNCRATYEVPDRLLAGGTKPVRCARCGTTWTPEAPPPPPPEPLLRRPAPPPEPPPPPSALEPPLRADQRLAGFRPRGEREEVETTDESLPPVHYEDEEPRGRAALIGWLLSLLLLAVIIWAALAYRDAVMAAWPASERIYAALGLR
jgi:predicted Zn finger-like uncharacterized protein